jgi:hypothetical protein
MWFNVYDYPKFVACKGILHRKFEAAGFSTYRTECSRNWDEGYHWLDDHEFTWFVLRYS